MHVERLQHFAPEGHEVGRLEVTGGHRPRGSGGEPGIVTGGNYGGHGEDLSHVVLAAGKMALACCCALDGREAIKAESGTGSI